MFVSHFSSIRMRFSQEMLAKSRKLVGNNALLLTESNAESYLAGACMRVRVCVCWCAVCVCVRVKCLGCTM